MLNLAFVGGSAQERHDALMGVVTAVGLNTVFKAAVAEGERRVINKVTDHYTGTVRGAMTDAQVAKWMGGKFAPEAMEKVTALTNKLLGEKLAPMVGKSVGALAPGVDTALFGWETLNRANDIKNHGWDGHKAVALGAATAGTLVSAADTVAAVTTGGLSVAVSAPLKWGAAATLIATDVDAAARDLQRTAKEQYGIDVPYEQTRNMILSKVKDESFKALGIGGGTHESRQAHKSLQIDSDKPGFDPGLRIGTKL